MRMRALAAALTLGLVVAQSANAEPAPTLTDGQIVAIYEQVNGFDIGTALLAQSRGHLAQTRALAEHVAADHIGVRVAVLEIARSHNLGFSLPEARVEAARSHATAMARLSGLSGAAFDCAYAAHEVQFHRDAIGAVRGLLLPAAQSPELRRHFEDVLPAFEYHLSQTEALQRGLGQLCN